MTLVKLASMGCNQPTKMAAKAASVSIKAVNVEWLMDSMSLVFNHSF